MQTVPGGTQLTGSNKVQSVETLRGLAALSVTWFHLTATQPGWLHETGSYGWLGVDAFFVLSGFVIPLSLHASGYRPQNYGRFLLRRAIRIEIPYLASIAIVVALQYLSAIAPGYRGEAPDFSALQLLSHVFYIIPLTEFEWVNVVYWTLAYEFAFYLILGLVYTNLWKMHLAATATVAMAIFGALGAATGHWDSKIFLFFIGIAAFRQHVRRDGWPTTLAGIGVATLAMSVLGDHLSALTGMATALLVLLVRFPRFQPLIWLGGISYSLYLLHVPIGGRVVNLGQRFIEGEWPLFGLSLAALAASLLASWGFHRLVESPAQEAARRLSRKVHSAAHIDNVALTDKPPT